MSINILSEIDAEIALLRQARSLLVSSDTAGIPSKAKVGRPKKKKRNLTPEGRARIAEAVRRRWAKQKKTAK